VAGTILRLQLRGGTLWQQQQQQQQHDAALILMHRCAAKVELFMDVRAIHMAKCPDLHLYRSSSLIIAAAASPLF
jgi:hypothetical protein